MKKYLVILAIGIVFIFSGCQSGKVQNNNEEKTNTEKEKSSVASNVTIANPCMEERIDIPNYGSKGKRLANCFVEYPGEPSRQDDRYYIVEDICGQFTKEFFENMLGEKIDKIELPKVSGINNCTYYLGEKNYIMLNLEYLSVENQKVGNEMMKRRIAKEKKIPLENMVVYEEDGSINVIYLILGSKKFISMRPSSKEAISGEKFIELASKIGESIKNYK